MIIDGSSRQSSPPPSHDYDKFNFLPHVLNLLNLIHSDADTGAVSQEVDPLSTWLIQAVQLRLAFHEARSEANKITGSNLGVKEQEIVIARLTEQVNAKMYADSGMSLTNRKFLEQLREMNVSGLRNGDSKGEAMDVDTKTEQT